MVAAAMVVPLFALTAACSGGGSDSAGAADAPGEPGATSAAGESESTPGAAALDAGAGADAGAGDNAAPSGTAGEAPLLPGSPLESAVNNMDSTLESLRGILDEAIPSSSWRQVAEAEIVMCDEGEGRYSAPQFMALGGSIPDELWPRIEQLLVDRGYAPARDEQPVEGNLTLAFYAEDGANVSVHSTGGSGAAYSGSVPCSEGYAGE